MPVHPRFTITRRSPDMPPEVHIDPSEDGDRIRRAVLAAQTSHRAGGAVLPEASGYNLPPLVTGLDILQMGAEAWEGMQGAATWHPLHNADAMINLDHPDVKAVL